MSLYYAVGQKLICPIGKFLLHTMQINNSFKLIDSHSYTLLQPQSIDVLFFFIDELKKINIGTNKKKTR
jgi:hypothetical protein